MKKLLFILLFCTIPVVSAGTLVTLTVDWTPFASPLYTGIVCLENTELFGEFDTIIMEYSQNNNQGSGSGTAPADIYLLNEGDNIYCADLDPEYWDSAYTLDNVKITVKYGPKIVFQDFRWSLDVPVSVDAPHMFYSLTSVNISLSRGWNLFSIPVIPVDASISKLFSNISYSNLLSYDSGWYVPSEINFSHGYWVKLDGSATLAVTGFNLASPSLRLDNGWNLIGYPYLEKRNISSILNQTVYSYDKSWLSYNPLRQSNSLTEFTPGFAYWVHS